VDEGAGQSFEAAVASLDLRGLRSDGNGNGGAELMAMPLHLDDEGFLGGMRAGAGLGAVVFILGLTFGALARAHGWGLIAPLACSAVVFSS
jgi:hypothetical protein